jgi:hypothetical protein
VDAQVLVVAQVLQHRVGDAADAQRRWESCR